MANAPKMWLVVDPTDKTIQAVTFSRTAAREIKFHGEVIKGINLTKQQLKQIAAVTATR